MFGAEHANVQPHARQANAAVYLLFLKPGETVLGLDLSQGVSRTTSAPVNFSGLMYHAVHYGVNDEGLMSYDRMSRARAEHKPKMIPSRATARTHA